MTSIPLEVDEDCGEWIDCWQCGGAGFHDLYEEDPMWYDEDDIEICDICAGKGGWTAP